MVTRPELRQAVSIVVRYKTRKKYYLHVSPKSSDFGYLPYLTIGTLTLLDKSHRNPRFCRVFLVTIPAIQGLEKKEILAISGHSQEAKLHLHWEIIREMFALI